MFIPDYAKTVKTALVADWAVSHPTWDPTLEVPAPFDPTAGRAALLVADDGGPALVAGAWLVDATPRRPVLRLTGFAEGCTEARECAVTAVVFVKAHRPGIARIEDVSVPLITRDPETGAYLASITVPVIVRQTA